MPSYDNWFCHGETLERLDNTEVNNQKQATVRGDDMRGMIHDAFGGCTEFIDSDINERGNLATRKPRGPTLLKDVWKLPPGKTIDVSFNSRNQSIGKEGRKLASFLGIVARTLELTPLNVDDWRNFDNEQKKKLVDFVRKKFSFPKCGEAFVLKSLGMKWKDYKCEIKGEYMSKYKTKDSLLKNRPNRIPRDQWSGLVSYWLSDKAKRRTQAKRNNRANQKMPHTGGSKSIATLMHEQAENGIEPTRAEIFLLTHKKRVDGRPLDDDSAKAIDMINERMTNNERSTDQPPHNVAWEGDVYSQVLGNEKSGYVRGLGLGPTPSVLWGSKSSVENIVVEDSSNEAVQRLEQEITKLKEKQNEEMDLMKQNHEKLQSELLRMRQFMQKYAPNESFPQDINDTSNEQVPNHNSGQGVPQSSRISSNAEITLPHASDGSS
ncbi:uncharacterized protein LOC125869753 [Solanum stenotomum]|uniref:uncharacterized protein LOC125863858 n=1 Tax=Solanum stenotomum TaxID=172797 RepID=UPI0020D1D1FE|nr:uncharacterized protein LOC125863858 [Solanum stenotomum]XP_049406150.1 uncharacterized protein LOC125869753 [Solanum stenotomum]